MHRFKPGAVGCASRRQHRACEWLMTFESSSDVAAVDAVIDNLGRDAEGDLPCASGRRSQGVSLNGV